MVRWIKIKHVVQLSVSLMFLPFDIFCDLLLYRPTVMWNLIVFYDKKAKIVDGEIVYESVFQEIIGMNELKEVEIQLAI